MIRHTKHQSPLVISEQMVQRAVDVPAAFRAIERSYVCYSRHQTVTPPTVTMPVRGGTFFAFPSYLIGRNFFICKLATFYPKNRIHGLPSVQPRIFLYESATGSLLAMIEARHFAGIRTALSSAVGIKHLLKTAPKTVAVLGSGVQARSHALALTQVFKTIRTVRAHSPTRSHLFAFVQEMRPRLKDVRLEACTNSREAVKGADVIVCVTNSRTPVFEDDAVKDGACILAVGGMSRDVQEVPDATIARSDVVVDAIQQADSYAEIVGPRSRGISVRVLGEIGAIAGGKKRVTFSKRPKIFKHHGLPVTDAALAELVYKSVSKK